MGFVEFSIAVSASRRPGDSGGLPNSVISAPAMNVRPSHARTPTLMALTGGLSIQMMPMSPRFSNLPCTNVSNGMIRFLVPISHRRNAAVKFKFRTGHELGFVRCKIQHRIGDIVRLAKASQRHLPG